MRKVLLQNSSAVIAVLLAAAFASRAARSQTDDIRTYPNRPIHIVAAAAAGGTMDVVARLIGQKLSESFGQPVIIDNRPGASTIIGTEYVARAPADGYTLLSAPLASVVVNPAVYPMLRYSTQDFTPPTISARLPSRFPCNPDRDRLAAQQSY